MSGIDIYDRRPQLEPRHQTILDAYLDTSGERNMNGQLSWISVKRWCDYHGGDSEHYYEVIRFIDARIEEWRAAKSTR